MKNIVDRCLRSTWKYICTEADTVSPEHWNESVFRYFFVKRLYELDPKCAAQSEWHGIDLIFCHRQELFAIEFKFYVARRKFHLDDKSVIWQGKASKQNYTEFETAIHRLEQVNSKQVKPRLGQGKRSFDRAYLLLLFGDPDGSTSFSSRYGRLADTPDQRFTTNQVVAGKLFGDRTASIVSLEINLKK